MVAHHQQLYVGDDKVFHNHMLYIAVCISGNQDVKVLHRAQYRQPFLVGGAAAQGRDDPQLHLTQGQVHLILHPLAGDGPLLQPCLQLLGLLLVFGGHRDVYLPHVHPVQQALHAVEMVLVQVSEQEYVHLGAPHRGQIVGGQVPR